MVLLWKELFIELNVFVGISKYFASDNKMAGNASVFLLMVSGQIETAEVIVWVTFIIY